MSDPPPADPWTVYQVIYSSAAVVPFSDRALTELLMRARVNNGRLGVTGLLLHHEGSFLQVLEGAKSVLDSLFRIIALDKRHHRIVDLLLREIGERQFGDWEMGFVSATALADPPPGYSDYLRVRGLPGEAGDAAARMLSAFRNGRFRSYVSA